METLLSRLDGVRQVKPNGWMSRCPAHNGDGQSLSVGLVDNGYIVMHCFAHGCDISDIVAAVGMTVSDLFPEPLPDRHYKPTKLPVPSIDVLRVMRQELAVVQVLMSDFEAGRLTHESLERGRVCAQRLQKALDLCSA
jgi:hypothetical protein